MGGSKALCRSVILLTVLFLSSLERTSCARRWWITYNTTLDQDIHEYLQCVDDCKDNYMELYTDALKHSSPTPIRDLEGRPIPWQCTKPQQDADDAAFMETKLGRNSGKHVREHNGCKSSNPNPDPSVLNSRLQVITGVFSIALKVWLHQGGVI